MDYHPHHLRECLEALAGDPLLTPLNGVELDFAEGYLSGDNRPTVTDLEPDPTATEDDLRVRLQRATRLWHSRAQQILQNHSAL